MDDSSYMADAPWRGGDPNGELDPQPPEYTPEDEEYPALCPQCDEPSESVTLGVLGSLQWHRCRGCGIDFATIILPTKR
jgi:hypothetical protein